MKDNSKEKRISTINKDKNNLMEEINALADDIKGLKFEITIKEKENHEK